MVITHEVSEPWRSHLGQTRTRIADLQREAYALQQHLRWTLGVLVAEAQLPPSDYSLSLDGTQIIGEIADPPGAVAVWDSQADPPAKP